MDVDLSHTNRGLSALRALKSLKQNKIVAQYLSKKLSSTSDNVRVGAAWALQSLPQRAAVRSLKHRALKDKNILVRMYCISALRYLALDHPPYETQFMPIFLKSIRHRSERIRSAGYKSLERIRLPKAIEALRGALKDSDPLIRATASIWLDLPDSK
jgi:HEAT repeat protein